MDGGDRNRFAIATSVLVVNLKVLFSALRSGVAPATVGLSRPLSDILLGCASGELQDISFSAEAKRYAAMSNSFGFGGTNASLVFSLPPPS